MESRVFRKPAASHDLGVSVPIWSNRIWYALAFVSILWWIQTAGLLILFTNVSLAWRSVVQLPIFFFFLIDRRLSLVKLGQWMTCKRWTTTTFNVIIFPKFLITPSYSLQLSCCVLFCCHSFVVKSCSANTDYIYFPNCLPCSANIQLAIGKHGNRVQLFHPC